MWQAETRRTDLFERQVPYRAAHLPRSKELRGIACACHYRPAFRVIAPPSTTGEG
jgi:hypothetical protein